MTCKRTFLVVAWKPAAADQHTYLDDLLRVHARETSADDCEVLHAWYEHREQSKLAQTVGKRANLAKHVNRASVNKSATSDNTIARMLLEK